MKKITKKIIIIITFVIILAPIIWLYYQGNKVVQILLPLLGIGMAVLFKETVFEPHQDSSNNTHIHDDDKKDDKGV